MTLTEDLTYDHNGRKYFIEKGQVLEHRENWEISRPEEKGLFFYCRCSFFARGTITEASGTVQNDAFIITPDVFFFAWCQLVDNEDAVCDAFIDYYQNIKMQGDFIDHTLPDEKLIYAGFDNRFTGVIGQNNLDDYLATGVAKVSSLAVGKSCEAPNYCPKTLSFARDRLFFPDIGAVNVIKGTEAILAEERMEISEEQNSCYCDYKVAVENETGQAEIIIDGLFTFHWVPPEADSKICAVFNEHFPAGNTSLKSIGDGQFIDYFGLADFSAVGYYPAEVKYPFGDIRGDDDFNVLPMQNGRQTGLDYLQPLAKERCEGEIISEIIDANPEFVAGGFLQGLPSDQIKELPVADLAGLQKRRIGVAMDSVSQVLIRFETPTKKNIAIQTQPDAGRFDLCWGDSTHRIDDRFYGFLLYTPPIQAPEGALTGTVEGLKRHSFKYEIQLIDSNGIKGYEQEMILVPAPVVLIHGTFDTPENCWRTPIFPGGLTMVSRLENDGFKVFTVDYSQSNGLGRLPEVCPGQSFLYNSSCFETNKQVVFKNPGGIKEAVEYYRNTLNIACTRADVIGHSLGGVLARVYASENYEVNPTNISTTDYSYKRENNFMKGDINRLITISSTHHGSDMAWYLYLLEKESVNDTLSFIEDTLNFATLKNLDNAALLSTSQLGVIWLLEGIRPDAGAIMDQIPGSPALRKIGKTEIPAHAIVSVADKITNAIDDPADPHHSYYNRALFTAMVFYFSQSFFDYVISQVADQWHKLPAHLKKNESRVYKGLDIMYLEMYKDDREAFKNLYKDPLLKQWQSFLKLNNLIKETLQDTLLPFDLGDVGIADFDDDLLDYITGGNLENIEFAVGLGFKLKELANFQEFVDRIRYMVFKNDKNDFTVRYDSQLGFENILSDPDEKFFRMFSPALHGFTPRYPDIQDHVLNVLNAGLDRFHPDGFPPAGRNLPIWLPDPGDLAEDVTGCESICWSGYVPKHAREFARIANEENVVLLARPVNPDATPLIANNRATKGMPVKGKSSNWGPHRGLLAVDQRYSKLWKLYSGPKRDDQIKKFNGKVDDLLQVAPQLVAKAHLNDLIFNCEGKEEVYEMYVVNDDLRSEAELEIRLLKKGTNTIFTWDPLGSEPCPVVDCASNCTLADLDTFFVQANPDPELAKVNEGQAPLYTADYDLLSIGFFDARIYQNPNSQYKAPTFDPSDWDCERGFISASQKTLVAKINKGIQDNTDYTAGNVVHHGPENHFIKITLPNFDCDPGEVKSITIPGSPYVDYPITAFEPHPDRRFNTTGIIRTIPMGPPGYRDIHLKEYLHKMRVRGFDLYANPTAPGWQWEYHRPYSYEEGFDPRDAPNLPQSVAQIPKPTQCDCTDRQQTLRQQILKTDRTNNTLEFELKVSPNPTSDHLNIQINNPKHQKVKFLLVDPLGKLAGSLEVILPPGTSYKQWVLPSLPKGVYFLHCVSSDFAQTKTIIVK